MKSKAKILWPVHESLVLGTYASSEAQDLKQQGDKSTRRQIRGWYVKDCTLFMLNNCTCFFSHAVVLPKTNSVLKVFEGYHQNECQTVLIQIRPDFLSDLIWVQTVCKGINRRQKSSLSGPIYCKPRTCKKRTENIPSYRT